MATNNKEIVITTSEVAKMLGWKWNTANSIRKRKSPKSRYNTYLECEKKLREAKINLIKQFKEQ